MWNDKEMQSGEGGELQKLAGCAHVCVPGWGRWGEGMLEDDGGAEERSAQRRSEEELYHSVADWQWKWGGGEERCRGTRLCSAVLA